METEKSLQIIEDMINASKTNYKRHHGIYFLFWGYLSIIVVSLFMILKNTVGMPVANYVWGLFFLGFVFNIYQMRRSARERPVVSKIDKMVAKVWLGVSIGIATLFGASPVLGWMMLPLVLVVIAIATYIHGAILSYKPFIFGSILMFILASISFYMPSIDVVLGLFVAGIVLGYLLPGHMLRNEKDDV
ncbi:MAG: hypothetical protein NXI00_11805 [Cytophagales bacterium]|nr:hypothetical protein [Cytophagales bacterium]